MTGLPADPWGLSPREREVVAAIVEHADNKSTARALNLSEQTVKAHLTAAGRRMGLRPESGLRIRVALAWDRWAREFVET